MVIEFWLGSHAHTTSADQVPCTEQTKVRKQVPGDPSCNVKPELVEPSYNQLFAAIPDKRRVEDLLTMASAVRTERNPRDFKRIDGGLAGIHLSNVYLSH